MERIFIVNYGYNKGWIIDKLAQDMQRVFQSLGYQCRRGELNDYEGEEICYHLQHHWTTPIPQAKHNSVFYTHTINVLGEMDLESIKGKFDSYICMSPEDAQYLIELGFDKEKVYGRTLPIRNSYIKPLSLGIFSQCKGDGVKKEEWLLDYCRNNPDSINLNFVFIGAGWENVCVELSKLGCSFEWHNASLKLPFEYQFQINKLSTLDYYIYMGMDGGAMGTYDAYAMDVPLCVAFDGFHKSIPNLDYTFDNEQSFFEQMDIILKKHMQRLTFFTTHTPENYAKWILNVWKGEQTNTISEYEKKCLSYHTVLEKKRDNYFILTRSGLRAFITRRLMQYKQNRELKNKKK